MHEMPEQNSTAEHYLYTATHLAVILQHVNFISERSKSQKWLLCVYAMSTIFLSKFGAKSPWKHAQLSDKHSTIDLYTVLWAIYQAKVTNLGNKTQHNPLH